MKLKWKNCQGQAKMLLSQCFNMPKGIISCREGSYPSNPPYTHELYRFCPQKHSVVGAYVASSQRWGDPCTSRDISPHTLHISPLASPAPTAAPHIQSSRLGKMPTTLQSCEAWCWRLGRWGPEGFSYIHAFSANGKESKVTGDTFCITPPWSYNPLQRVPKFQISIYIHHLMFALQTKLDTCFHHEVSWSYNLILV